MIVVAQTGKNRFSPITSCREQRKSSFRSFYKYCKAWKGAFSGIVSLNVMNHFMPYLINNRDRNRFLSRSGTGSGAKKFAKILSFLCHCRCDSCRWKSSQFAWELWIVDGEGSCTQCGNTLALITSKKNESSRDSAMNRHNWLSTHKPSDANFEGQCHSTVPFQSDWNAQGTSAFDRNW